PAGVVGREHVRLDPERGQVLGELERALHAAAARGGEVEADKQHLHPRDGTDSGSGAALSSRSARLLCVHELLHSLLLLLALAAVVLTAAAIVACLRLGSLAESLLAVYLVAWAEIVLTTLVLTVPGEVTRPGLLLCVAAGLAVGGTVWARNGRPRLPPLRPALAGLRPALRDPAVAIAGAAFLVVL